MSRRKLDHWFELRFPRDVSEQQVIAALAALSGLPHGSRLTLELTADNNGISHRLGVSDAAQGTVTASLRAAIPSLRLSPIPAPVPSPTTAGFIWQLVPRVAALRADGLPATSAALLASLFPLDGGETIRLLWHLRPGARPTLPIPDASKDGRLRVLRTKLAQPGVTIYGELAIQAAGRSRRRQLFQRVATMLWSLGTPHGHLSAEPRWYGWLAYLLGRRGRHFSAPELAAVIGWPIDGPDLPNLELGAAKRLVPSRSLPTTGRVLGVSDFAGHERPVALSPEASTKGTYVLGPTGTGKTSLLKNLIVSDLEAGSGLICLETNGDLIKELADLIPDQRTKDVVLLDATDPDFAVGFNPFASSAAPALIADQLSELFQRQWAAYFGPRTAQLAHMGLLTLARHPGSTLIDLARLFLDPAFRAERVSALDDPLGLALDWQWFEGLSAAEQHNVVAPLLNKVRQFTARPTIRDIVGQARPALNLSKLIANRQVLLVHLPKGLIGSETAQLLGCLILTSAWQAFAQRAVLEPNQRHPFGLYVDEVQDFASAPLPWDELLAQGRKYGLSLTIAHQNLEQLPRELRQVALANARTKLVFALSGSDATVMEKLFAPALTANDLQALDAYSVAAQIALNDGSLSRPVTLTTPAPPKPTGSTAAVRQHSRQHYGQRREQVDAELRAQVERPQHSSPIGRKRRGP